MGRTTLLNPRTNDPYINKEGKLMIATDNEELGQRFDILVHTREGSEPLNVEYGIDYEWIKKQTLEPETVFFMDLAKKIEDGVESIIQSFDILSMEKYPNGVEIDVILRGTRGENIRTSVGIQ